jgi:ABC-2 type transport system ATP-binding protein
MASEIDGPLLGSPASPALEVRELFKTFGGRRVVNGVSFELQRGEIFGFLGPNGSGKTTTMRMALDLIRPDSGSVALLGGMPVRRALRRVGYLPEERGLFQRARVIDVLRYLGRLKGLEANTAERRAEETLERVGLADCARAKVQGLSRGMTQLIQFSGALLHHPDLIVLDEPFAGLDPLNVELIKELIREERARGASIIFSTHIMSDVEELCERVLLIDAGTTLLYGSLMELKRSRGKRTVKIAADRRPESVAEVAEPVAVNGHFEYKLAAGSEPQAILRSFLDAQIPVERFEVALPTLNEIFIEEVRGARRRE